MVGCFQSRSIMMGRRGAEKLLNPVAEKQSRTAPERKEEGTKATPPGPSRHTQKRSTESGVAPIKLDSNRGNSECKQKCRILTVSVTYLVMVHGNK